MFVTPEAFPTMLLEQLEEHGENAFFSTPHAQFFEDTFYHLGGFGSPQWRTLYRRAMNEWVKKYAYPRPLVARGLHFKEGQPFSLNQLDARGTSVDASLNVYKSAYSFSGAYTKQDTKSGVLIIWHIGVKSIHGWGTDSEAGYFNEAGLLIDPGLSRSPTNTVPSK